MLLYTFRYILYILRYIYYRTHMFINRNNFNYLEVNNGST